MTAMATTEHRVATHLGLAASDYDAEIRRYIPTYEQMIDTVVGIVGTLDAPYVIDLAMLEVAGARVVRHGGRAELRRGSFDDALPACDAVVASLALHHVPELD